MTDKKGIMILNSIFILTNIFLYLIGKIDARVFILATISSGYFLPHITKFNYNDIKSYFYLIFMMVIYVLFALIEFS